MKMVVMGKVGVLHLFLYSILYLKLFKNVLSFNLAVESPLVKRGVPGSYFGYSLSFHLMKTDHNSVKMRSIVGAPRGNITDYGESKYEAYSKITRPGVVYLCHFEPRDVCDQLHIDQTQESREYDGWKEDGWLGVAVASQQTPEGHVLVCAHRYKELTVGSILGVGICYSLHNNFDNEQYISPCMYNEVTKANEDFGFCLSGISGDVSDEWDVAIGTPGVRIWSGSLTKKSTEISLDSDSNIYWGPPSDFKSEEQVMGYIKSHSYLGMSVKIGRLTKQKFLVYLGGAPREEDIGHVLFFKQGQDNDKLDYMDRLKGEQFYSYFGYELALGDINDDGELDLIVGAPFYRDVGIGGAIYAYLNNDGFGSQSTAQKITGRKMKDSECMELSCFDARFGWSIAYLGDSDKDGYGDIAVGAPYEGPGAVYIFRGSKKGLIPEYSQRITAQDMVNPLVPIAPRSFGAALASKNGDADDDGYSDLLVGAFQSDSMFVLRSRPVVTVSTVFQSLPNIVNPMVKQCPADGVPKNCLAIRVCFKPNTVTANKHIRDIKMNYTIEAERFAAVSMSRVYFKGVTGKDVHVKKDFIIMNYQNGNESTCNEHGVYFYDTIKDFLNPVGFRLTYLIDDGQTPLKRDGLESLTSYPILRGVSETQTIMVDFKKNCGTDEKCQSDLVIKSHLSLNKLDDTTYRLRVGIDEKMLLTVEVHNEGEDAHQANLYIKFPPTIAFVGTGETGDKNKESCGPSDAPSTIICFIGNPQPTKTKAAFKIRFDPKIITASSELLTLEIVANSTSEEINPLNNNETLSLEVIIESDIAIRGSSEPESVFFGGIIKGESVTTYADEIGPEVTHSYEIKNIGNARLPSALVTISWPYELQSQHPSGKHLLYLMSPPLLEGNVKCDLDPRLVNPLGVMPNQVQSGEVLHVITRPEPPPKKVNDTSDVARTKRKVDYILDDLTLDCDAKTARCHVINCSIEELRKGQSVVIRLKSRLWNSTFLEEFPDREVVKIYSKAVVFIDPSLNIKQINTDNDVLKIATLVFPELLEPRRLPLWVIIVSVLAGVFFLILLIILLWKVGFFERATRDAMATHQAVVQRDNL